MEYYTQETKFYVHSSQIVIVCMVEKARINGRKLKDY